MVRAGDGILDGADEGFDIVERDGAHGGDLENAVGERAFSAVDDEPAVAEGGAQEVKAGAVGEVDGRNGVRENVVGVEEGQADVFEACSEELGFFCLVGESICTPSSAIILRASWRAIKRWTAGVLGVWSLSWAKAKCLARLR